MSRRVGRYNLLKPIGSGGMGTVHLARLAAEGGFSRLVAIKSLHGARDASGEAVRTFLDEARIAAQVRHPNVVSTLDVLNEDGELMLVMDYVHGLSLSRLTRRPDGRLAQVPVPILSAVMAGVLHGLHAAHEAGDARGKPLGLVHRDVSPQNVLVGTDGLARLADFGVAKAAGRLQTTIDGSIKGKLAYMAPEQLRDDEINRRADIFSAGVILWELLTGRRLFDGRNQAAVVARLLEGVDQPPSTHAPAVSAALDALVMRCLASSPSARPETARDVARQLETVVPPASALDVAEWVTRVGGPALEADLALASDEERTAIAVVSTRKRRAIVLGIYRHEGPRVIEPVIDSLCAWLGEQIGVDVVHRPAQDYAALCEDIRRGQSDIAWLPPIALLELGDSVVPILTSSRGGRTDYECVVLVREDSPFQKMEDLRDKRAAWVDPWSASGYVVARVRFHELGFPTRGAFQAESFHGTHSAAVRAVVEGAADFAASYSGDRTREGETVSVEDWRWHQRYARLRLLVVLGRVPSDAIVASRSLPQDIVDGLVDALQEATNGFPMAPLVKALFGADRFVASGAADAYESLRPIVNVAEEIGLLPALTSDPTRTALRGR